MLKGYEDKLGRQLIQIRIADKNKRRFVSTNIRIAKDEWDGVNLKVKSIHPKSADLNQRIKRKLIEVESGLLDGNTPDVDFIKYVERCIKEWKNVNKQSSITQDEIELNKLKQFSKTPKYLSGVTNRWLEEYQDHLFSTGNSSNTVWKNFKFIKKVVRKAVKNRLIKENPFDLFTPPKYKNPQRGFLTEDEINALEKFQLETTSPTLRNVANWFLFATYSLLRFSDCDIFNKSKHIKNGRIIMRTKKTGI